MAKTRHSHSPHAKYLPQWWPTWLIVGLAWLLCRLPLNWIRKIGIATGNVLYRFAASRRAVTERNLTRCFPELTPGERDDLARRIFQNVSLGAIELMLPWLNPGRDLSPRFTVRGREHLDAALSTGRGVILVGGHFAVMDVISAPLSRLGPIDVMYRFNKNPVWEWLQVSGRQRYFDGVIEREDTRQVLRRLKAGRAIWYAADQDYGRKHSVFAPFFGVPAATIVATARFARLNDSPVLFMRQARAADSMHWSITFSPIIEDFPSGDDLADATRMNALLEAEVRKQPDQYLWLHKRFKTRPEGESRFYD